MKHWKGPGRLAIALVGVLGTARAPATAEEPVATRPAGETIGLRDALQVAVRQNPTLAARGVDVEIADAQLLASRGPDDWVVALSASGNSLRSDPVAGQPFQQTGTDTVAVVGSVTRGLSAGGRVGLEADGTYTRSETRIQFDPSIDPETFTSEVYTPRLSLTFFQPLLRGFGAQVARVDRVRAAAVRDVAVLERQQLAATVVRDVVQQYWELVYALEDLRIRHGSLELAREQLRITRAGIEVGKLAPTDATAVEQAIAVREEEILRAEQSVSERSLELRRLAGLEIAPDRIDLVATDALATVAGEPNLAEALTRARSQNPQLQTVRAQQRSARIEVEVTENGLLPQLDVNLSAGPQGSADTAGDAITHLVSGDTYQVVGGVTFSAPIGNRAARGAHRAAAARLRRARLDESDIQAQIDVAVGRAVNQVQSARKRMEVLAKATALAQQNLSVERARWEVGRATNFDVLQRQDELAQSQVREARARTDLVSAVALLDALTGDILLRHGLVVAAKP